jgi:type IV secretory pathway VirB10-like protein
MKRKIFAMALLAGATAALGAQQANDPYAGTSNPPPDDQITVTNDAPAKPAAGKRAAPSAAAGQAETAPAPTAVDPSINFPDPRGDDDIVHPVRPVAPSREPALSRRVLARTPDSDPDGDIVHARAPRPDELAEGTTIRVHLLHRLSTASTEKGEAFSSRVASDVLQNGVVLIPAGSRIEGQVAQVSSGHVAGHGAMRLRPETVVLPDGRRFQLYAQTSSTPGAKTHVGSEGTIVPNSRIKRDGIEYGGAVGAGVTAGAVVAGPAGALTGGLIGAGVVTAHLMVDHPQAVLEPGTVLIFTLTEPLELTPLLASQN